MEKHERYPEIFCVECITDDSISCKRDKDVKCLHCGMELCGYHIGPHLERVHFVDLEWKGMEVE